MVKQEESRTFLERTPKHDIQLIILITEYWNAPIESFQLCTLQTLNVAKRKVKPRLKRIKEAISCHNEAI